MHPFPHTYDVVAAGGPAGTVTVTSSNLPPLETTPPPQFDGPEGLWSPETLLCAAVADCYVLTFRGISRAARFEWITLQCRVTGKLERLEGVSQFTRYTTAVVVTIPDGTDVTKARALLERTEQSCLVSNSLRGARVLDVTVKTASG